jgi:hypothetical protein
MYTYSVCFLKRDANSNQRLLREARIISGDQKRYEN